MHWLKDTHHKTSWNHRKMNKKLNNEFILIIKILILIFYKKINNHISFKFLYIIIDEPYLLLIL